MAIDRDAAARAGIHAPRQHDHNPRYEADAFPDGALDMDPERHDTAGPCWPAWGPVRHSWGHYRSDCLDCRDFTAMASTLAELERLQAAHTGEQP